MNIAIKILVLKLKVRAALALKKAYTWTRLYARKKNNIKSLKIVSVKV